MSYITKELSQQSSVIAELFLFQFVNSGIEYPLTPDAVSYTLSGRVYLPTEMRRMDLSFSEDSENSGTKIEIATSSPFIQRLIGHNVREKVKVEIRRVQKEETVDADAYVFPGFIGNFVVNGGLTELEIISPAVALKRSMLGRKYSITCPYVLYNAYTCQAPKFVYGVAGVIDGMTGRSIISSTAFSAKPDNWFTNGFVEIGSHTYSIALHIGATCTLHNTLERSVLIGDSFQVFAGCNHTMANCIDKFDNIINYGGFPYIPVKNPFTGDPIV